MFVKEYETIHQLKSDEDNQKTAMKMCRFGTSFPMCYYTGNIAFASLVMLLMFLSLRIPGMLFITPMSEEHR